ncbi:MAG: serine protease [Patescibacteria group bacterium]
MIRTLLQLIGLLGIAGVIFVFLPQILSTSFEAVNTARTVSDTAPGLTAATSQAISESDEPAPAQEEKLPPTDLGLTQPDSQNSTANSQNTAQNKETAVVPSYPYPPLSDDALNTLTRSALINILCTTSSSLVRPIAGSGVIIDPRGVILTNAHVAQYVLLGSRPEVDLNCVIRTDPPAQSRWKASILYFPEQWLDEHAADLTKSRPMGTGERDYALLLITESATPEPLPPVFPFLPLDTRGDTATVNDNVFLAAYPAEFSGGNATRGFLSASSAIGVIQQLLTFNENTVDLYSLGSTVLAQSGSSGGAVVNAWGHLIGIITTTSDGETTAERDLHALTLLYINRDFLNSTSGDLKEFLSRDMKAQAAQFMQVKAPLLSQRLITELENR